MNLKLEEMHHGQTKILRLGGRMDLENLGELDRVMEHVMAAGFSKIIFNLIDITDISSTGVGRLMRINNTLLLKNGRLVLCELSPVCEYVLDLARLKDAFEIAVTEAAALKMLGEDPEA